MPRCKRSFDSLSLRRPSSEFRAVCRLPVSYLLVDPRFSCPVPPAGGLRSVAPEARTPQDEPLGIFHGDWVVKCWWLLGVVLPAKAIGPKA